MTLSRKNLRYIAANAMTMGERLNGDCEPLNTPGATQEAEIRIQSWCESAAAGDWDTFVSRLNYNHWTIAGIKPVIGKVKLPASAPEPGWVARFKVIVSDWETSTLSPAYERKFAARANSTPFLSLLLPVVWGARVRRDFQTRKFAQRFSKTALIDPDYWLLDQLNAILSPSLYQLFRIFRTATSAGAMRSGIPPVALAGETRQYRDFLEDFRGRGGLDGFFINRPMLARLVTAAVTIWTERTAELLLRIDSDAVLLHKHFGCDPASSRVTELVYGISDPHNGGAMVSKVVFASGLKIAYKPRNCSLEVGCRDLFEWLSRQGAPESALIPNTLARNSYGWSQWLDNDSNVTELDTFFRRSGAAACMLWVLGSIDLHFENCHVNKNWPVFVDLETALSPVIKSLKKPAGASRAVNIANNVLRQSVLSLGFLPTWGQTVDGKTFAVGGINSGNSAVTKTLRFKNINTDLMEILEEHKISLRSENTNKVLEANLLDVSSISAFKDGFACMFRFVMSRKAELSKRVSALSSSQIRVVLRATRVYGLLRKKSLECDNIANGVDYSLALDYIARLSKWQDSGASVDADTIAVEVKSLCELDIPHFSVKAAGAGLKIGQGATIWFETSAINNSLQRIAGLNQEVMDLQLGFISCAFQARLRNDPAEHSAEISVREKKLNLTAPGNSGKFLSEALRIADSLERSSFRAGGGAAWLGIKPLPLEDRAQLVVVDDSLYSGLSGIACFLGALYSITLNPRWKRLALEAIAPVIGQISSVQDCPRYIRAVGIGGATGAGGVIYALSLLSKFLKDRSFYEAGVRLALHITSPVIAADTKLDVIAGSAGTIFSLLALWDISHDEALLAPAILCGEHLLYSRCEGPCRTRAWKTLGSRPLTGSSHGAAGISDALARLFLVTGQKRFLQGAADGLCFERSLFNAAVSNWPDFRACSVETDRPTFPRGRWCHGAGGIALSRLSTQRAINDLQIAGEISSAVANTQKFNFSNSACGDYICCGTFSQIAILNEAGLRLKRRELIQKAEVNAISVIRRAHNAPGFRWLVGSDSQNPGFFSGLSGIGYECLRLFKPSSLPCVILWDTP